MKKFVVMALALSFAAVVYASGKPKPEAVPDTENSAAVVSATASPAAIPAAQKIKVTFIELGSVNCKPCKMMVPVMKEVEEKYGSQVKVVFHDVWTPEGAPMGRKYGIRGIPTQIFLDENGKEFYRHIGYFPMEQLVQVLKTGGVKVE
ncbi:MAG: thioredoxin family protein [Spirochaetia bacterium]|nr:thioredoxin family protein [Spirochaetia bacterium]